MIGFGNSPVFAVESLALARGNKNDFRGCRCDAKKSDSNRKRGARHRARSYHFVIAVWTANKRAKEANSW